MAAMQTLNKGNFLCKGPKADVCSVCLRNSKGPLWLEQSGGKEGVGSSRAGQSNDRWMGKSRFHEDL